MRLIVLCIVAFFLRGCSSTETTSDLAVAEVQAKPKAWAFPGKPGNRFPIVANNIFRSVDHAQGRRTPDADTLYSFLRKLWDAEFNMIRLNLTPPDPNAVSDPYYEGVLSAVRKINAAANSRPLSMMVVDRRIRKGYDSTVTSLLGKRFGIPEVYGFSVDEPKEEEFPTVASWSRVFNRGNQSGISSKLLYVNLFGLRTGESHDHYIEYVTDWVRIGEPRLLSFDYYAVWDDERAAKHGDELGSDWAPDYFFNLELFRQESVELEVPFWFWVLVHEHWSDYSKKYYRRATEADIRFQVYSALAYGAKGILYYNAWNPEPENDGWNQGEGLLDPRGHATPLLASVRTLNKEVAGMGETLLGLRSVGVYHADPSFLSKRSSKPNREMEPLHKTSDPSGGSRYGIKMASWNQGPELTAYELEHKVVTNLIGGAGLVGIFTDGAKKEYALIVVNKNRTNEETLTLELDENVARSGGQVVLEEVVSGKRITGRSVGTARRQFSLSLPPGGGLLLRVDSTNQ